MYKLAVQNLIGAVLFDEKRITDCYGVVTEDMIADIVPKLIYRAMLNLFNNSKPIDLISISNEIDRTKVTEQDIGEYVKACMTATTTSVNIQSHIDCIVSNYRISKAKIIANKYINELSVDNVADKLPQMATDLETLMASREKNTFSMAEIVQQNKDWYFSERVENGLKCGFHRLDQYLTLEKKDLIIIGARPAVGKSAFANEIVLHLAEQGKKIAFYNLEMSERQVYERFLCRKSGIPLDRVRNAQAFLNDEKERFVQANKELSGYRLIVSSSTKTLGEIKAEIKHAEVDVLVIDYLQLLRIDGKYENRTKEVGAISRGLKQIAMELNIPVIALSQLNRATEHQSTKEPTMADLREAGDIEQDASVILMLWNVLEDDWSKKGLKIEKNRMGAAPIRQLMEFEGLRMKWTESHETLDDVKQWKKAKTTPFDK